MKSTGSDAPEGALHIPVLADEVIKLLHVREGAIVVDVTAGAGGHLRRFAEAVGPPGRVIGLDRDPRAFEKSAAGGVAQAFADRVTLRRARFSEVRRVLDEEGVSRIDALLCDLGVSSMQLNEAERGFSFLREGPLDMRMDPTTGETAYDLLDRLSERELADVLYRFGDEHRSRRIARAIKKSWPIEDSTTALAELVARALGGKRGRIHPATRTFQALRIAVNRELDELDALLDALLGLLAPGGRAAVISFHSLEDRRVKQRFREGARSGPAGEALYRLLTKRPVVPSPEEVARNPRSRSAKLRAVERVGDG